MIASLFTSVREPNALIDRSCHTYHMSNIFTLFLKKNQGDIGLPGIPGNPGLTGPKGSKGNEFI